MSELARPLGLAGRLRLGMGRPGGVVVTPTPAQPLLVDESGNVIVAESGSAIATEQA